jgi:hypothetical protein
VLKLQKKGSGAPSREPPVDAETQKAMMAWYYKKQEEQKVGWVGWLAEGLRQKLHHPVASLGCLGLYPQQCTPSCLPSARLQSCQPSAVQAGAALLSRQLSLWLHTVLVGRQCQPSAGKNQVVQGCNQPSSTVMLRYVVLLLPYWLLPAEVDRG